MQIMAGLPSLISNTKMGGETGLKTEARKHA